jgi:hypothetical protein
VGFVGTALGAIGTVAKLIAGKSSSSSSAPVAVAVAPAAPAALAPGAPGAAAPGAPGAMPDWAIPAAIAGGLFLIAVALSGR